MTIIAAFSLLFAGTLAGEEFIVRYGVQPALSTLDDHSHLRARKALVSRLRWVVPALMLPTVVLALVTVVSHGTVLGWLGVATLVAFLLFSFLGTVPINIKVNDWDVENPPTDWKALVARWELIDVFRSAAAILAFVFLLAAVLFV
jgi:hypothetical protein